MDMAELLKTFGSKISETLLQDAFKMGILWVGEGIVVSG